MYEVVDGQQRLTTLNLIFARLREGIENAAAKQELGKRILPQNPFTGQTETPRLSLRQRDQKFFREYVLESKIFPTDRMSQLDPPKVRMLQSIRVVDQFLKDHDQQWLKRFAHYILQNVFVVFVKTENFQSAYRLFNVLNNRGQSLSNADLIKNQLFSRFADNDARSEELEELWEELEETAESENLDTFLGYHRTTLVADKARKTLADEFEPIIAEDQRSPLDFVQTLIDSARNYDKIKDGQFSDALSLRSLEALKRVSYDEWIPALLAYLNNPVPALSEPEYVSLLEKITMQNWVRRLGRAMRNTIYYRLINAIKKKESADGIRAIFRESANNREFMSLIGGDVYGWPGAKAILLRLEEGAQDDSVTKKFSGTVTIEHVLPQTLTEQYWTERFSDEEHQFWLHKLGNITLLSGRKNTKAQNYSFPRKKDVFLKRNEKVSFDLTKEVCEQNEWTVKEIKDRHQKMVEIASKLWMIT